MLRLIRPPLSPAIQSALDRWQQATDKNEVDSDPWRRFHQQDVETKDALLQQLKTMFHDKCAYCETLDADEIEHFWPKSPHQPNRFRGSSQLMFVWENLLLACHKCNSFACKGSRMIFDDGQPRLLNPCLDEPLRYFTIQIADNSVLTAGYLEPRPDLSPAEHARAEYTIHLLKLNKRRLLVEGRRAALRHFFDWVEMLATFGPSFELPSGYTIHQRFLDMLHAHNPFLAPIRQILHDDTELYNILLAKVPELAAVIAQWNLPMASHD